MPVPGVNLVLWCSVEPAQFLALSMLSGLADIPSAGQDVTQKNSCWPGKITLSAWSLSWILYSWLITNLIWSNVALTSGAKIQMSSRYSSKVTNCWSPRYCSNNLQQLYLAFERPKGIWVNQYRPEGPALNAVFCISSSAIANCK